MHDKMLRTSLFSTIDFIFLIKTWQKDGIGITKENQVQSFSNTCNRPSNIHSGITTWGHGGIVVFIQSICTWVSHLPSFHMDVYTTYGLGPTRVQVSPRYDYVQVQIQVYTTFHPLAPKATNIRIQILTLFFSLSLCMCVCVYLAQTMHAQTTWTTCCPGGKISRSIRDLVHEKDTQYSWCVFNPTFI